MPLVVLEVVVEKLARLSRMAGLWNSISISIRWPFLYS
jgi:hypothetical protein